jgi:Ni,Fe-hydrogenase III large subunit
LIGFETLFMQIFRFREVVMDTLESISGNRVNYSMNRIGGVNRDIQDGSKVLAVAREIRTLAEKALIPLLTTDKTVRARCKGVGVLTKHDAVVYGAVGPVARASGIDTDIRRDCSYLAYDKVEFAVPVQTDGDVMGRVIVRALEIVESCKIIEQCLERMPEGAIHAGDIYSVRAGEAAMRIEAPRGEVFYFIASDGTDKPLRVKVRTPSFANIPAVAAMVKNSNFADVPLIQAAVDPCYSCTDR